MLVYNEISSSDTWTTQCVGDHQQFPHMQMLQTWVQKYLRVHLFFTHDKTTPQTIDMQMVLFSSLTAEHNMSPLLPKFFACVCWMFKSHHHTCLKLRIRPRLLRWDKILPVGAHVEHAFPSRYSQKFDHGVICVCSQFPSQVIIHWGCMWLCFNSVEPFKELSTH